ncbi:MAG: amidohydrolase, partial [Candidatus Eisenbacteria bacterium]|nr:amidohydrolase [Candidatus Eisenbacteria bacterium]
GSGSPSAPAAGGFAPEAGASPAPDAGGLPRVRGTLRDLAPEMVRLRRDLHRHPEPGFAETRTAGVIAEWLGDCEGVRVRTGVARTGIIADLQGPDPRGPCVLLRADMDALRLQEENEAIPYRSVNDGVMHACGHDAHMATLMGVARYLATRRGRVRGHLRLLFQPAEEGPGGAAPMIAEGALRDPRPDVAFGLHVWGSQPLGYAGVRAGPMMAYTDEIEFRMRGRGGHGAYPHETVDTIHAAAQMIVGLQSVVSRSVDPTQPAVFSIGKIAGGSVMNIIAEEVAFDGTLRTLTPEVRETCHRRIREIAGGIDAACGTRTEVRFIDRYPAVVNDPALTDLAVSQIEAVLGAGRVRTDMLSMGGEDMSFYLREVPGCFFFLGAGNPSKGCSVPNHNPRFDVDEDVLPLGAEILVRLCEQFVGALEE